MLIMVYKLIKKLIPFILIFFLNTINSFANIIYDKEDIVISELDINYYIEIYNEKFNDNINRSKALKNLVIIKKLIRNLEKNNAGFLNRIDKEIYSEIGKENLDSQTILDIIRYFKTRNEFIINYFKNDFKKTDLENVFMNFDNLNFPISNNNCLTMIKMIDLKNNIEFINNFYENLVGQSEEIKISIDDEKYIVCINQQNKQILDREIFKYIEFKTEDNFIEFLYAK